MSELFDLKTEIDLNRCRLTFIYEIKHGLGEPQQHQFFHWTSNLCTNLMQQQRKLDTMFKKLNQKNIEREGGIKKNKILASYMHIVHIDLDLCVRQ